MANIDVDEVRDDLLDRLDNLVQSGMLSEQLRNKLSNDKRIEDAINSAYKVLAMTWPSSRLSPLINVNQNLTPASTTGNVSEYDWPTNAFTAREDMGLIAVGLDGKKRNPQEAVSLFTLQLRAEHSFYGDDFNSFAIDADVLKIYTPSAVAVVVDIIDAPQTNKQVDNGDSLLIDDKYFYEVSGVAFEELLAAIQNNSSDSSDDS